MSRGKQKSPLRTIVLRYRRQIQALYSAGYTVKDIYRSLDIDEGMTYDTFLKYSRLCTRGITSRSHSPQRAAFLSQIDNIRELVSEGYALKEVQKLCGLGEAMSRHYFWIYLRDYIHEAHVRITLGHKPQTHFTNVQAHTNTYLLT